MISIKNDFNFFIGDFHLENYLTTGLDNLLIEKLIKILNFFYKDELENIENKLLLKEPVKINLFLLGDTISGNIKNIIIDNNDDKENLIYFYAGLLNNFHSLFIYSIEKILDKNLDNYFINYKIILGNHDLFLPNNFLIIWEQIIKEVNNFGQNFNFKFSLIENKYLILEHDKSLIYSSMNYPVYLPLNNQFLLSKLNDIEYNNLILDNIFNKIDIIRNNIIDKYFFQEIIKKITETLDKETLEILKERANLHNLDLGIFYNILQIHIQKYISPEFNTFLKQHEIIGNSNIIELLSIYIKHLLKLYVKELEQYPFLNNFLNNVLYIDKVFQERKHNFYYSYENVLKLGIYIFSIIKQLFDIYQLIKGFEKSKNIDNLVLLTHFPFSIDDLDIISKDLKCLKSQTFKNFEKDNLYYYFNKDASYFLIINEIINIFNINGISEIKNVRIYSGHTHNNIICNFNLDNINYEQNIISFGYEFENTI